MKCDERVDGLDDRLLFDDCSDDDDEGAFVVGRPPSAIFFVFCTLVDLPTASELRVNDCI
jgi:hypothetical protein